MKLFYTRHVDQLIHHTQSSAFLVGLATQHDWGAVSYSEAGKPFVERGFVSISHSTHHLVCAHAECEIGVDMEVIRPVSQKLIERLDLNKLNPLLDWCQREAYFKLSADHDSILKPIPHHIHTHHLQHNECLIVVVSTDQIDSIEFIETSIQEIE